MNRPNIFRFTASIACFLMPAAVLADSFPPDIDATRFSNADLAPCPACLCVSAQGEVFAGVDLNGSLGKGPGKGRIVKLVDKDHDGVADGHTTFAKVDNVRGLISVGDKLYVLHTAYDGKKTSSGMDLAVLEDSNHDGVADGPLKVLVKGICSAHNINARGTDHSTNGIRMGIDGWIYIAVGDFGFHNATGTDGTKLTLLGGGIARVRPDGSELEMYTTGTRNIYDVAIDPFMNCYTRGNTNDGGGWNVRFLHHLQSGEYGYPRLFKNFATEIIPALEDLGGGSGVGSLFLSEPSWPSHYNNQPLMADWGRKAVYLHRLTPDGASFTQVPEEFARVSQVTDLDVDPSGQIFVSAWDGAGFKGDASKGYIVRLTPKGWKYNKIPQLATMNESMLTNGLKSPSATTRFYVQQEILTRPVDPATVKPQLDKLIQETSNSTEARVAALFTLAQIETDPSKLLIYAKDEALCEFALRAATDRLPRLEKTSLPLDPFVQVLQIGSPRQRAAAAIALGRLGNREAASTLLQVPFTKPSDEPPSQVAGSFSIKKSRKAEKKKAGISGPTGNQGESVSTPSMQRHAEPNSSILAPHLAVHALVALQATEACLAAVGTSSEDLALWALSYMHEESVVDGLISRLKETRTPKARKKILTTLARLYHKEAPYDGSWWWTTRPDTHGPYYKPVAWEASPRISAILEAETADASQADFLARLNDSHRLDLPKLGTRITETTTEEVATVDLAKIASLNGAVATTPIEDIILSIDKLKPDDAKGRQLFTQQGCVACHALDANGPALGPFMGQIGSIMSPDQIATAILRPSDTISQGFQSIVLTMKDGSIRTGFATETTADKIVLRDPAGAVTTIATADVKEEKHINVSMMPEGLANALSLDDFSALVHFLANKK